MKYPINNIGKITAFGLSLIPAIVGTSSAQFINNPTIGRAYFNVNFGLSPYPQMPLSADLMTAAIPASLSLLPNGQIAPLFSEMNRVQSSLKMAPLAATDMKAPVDQAIDFQKAAQSGRSFSAMRHGFDGQKNDLEDAPTAPSVPVSVEGKGAGSSKDSGSNTALRSGIQGILTSDFAAASGRRKWIGISGSWRTTNKQVEKDVRYAVREILARGGGIVAGGASGVDWFAADEALQQAPDGSMVKVVLPSTLTSYIAHIREWANGHDTGDPPIARTEADRIISLLDRLAAVNRKAIVEGPVMEAAQIDQNAYYARDTAVVDISVGIVAFQVNKSGGTQDTIDKARATGRKAFVKTYTLSTDKVYGRLKPRS